MKNIVFLMLAAVCLACTMSRKPSPIVEDEMTVDTVVATAIETADTETICVKTVFPTDEDKNIWVLVDSFRRTISAKGDYKNRPGLWEDSLSQCTLDALTAVEDTLTKRAFALYVTMSLYGHNECASEARTYYFYQIISNGNKVMSQIDRYMGEIPDSIKSSIVLELCFDICFEAYGCDGTENERPPYDTPEYHTYIFNSIATRWPELIKMCDETGITFEPKEDGILIDDTVFHT